MWVQTLFSELWLRATRSLCLSGSVLGVAWPPIGLRNNFNRVASPAAVKVRGNMITWSQVYRFLLWKCHSHNNIVKLYTTISLSQKCLSVTVSKSLEYRETVTCDPQWINYIIILLFFTMVKYKRSENESSQHFPQSLFRTQVEIKSWPSLLFFHKHRILYFSFFVSLQN